MAARLFVAIHGSRMGHLVSDRSVLSMRGWGYAAVAFRMAFMWLSMV